MSARLPLSPPPGLRVRLVLALLVAVFAFGVLPAEASLPALPAEWVAGEVVDPALARESTLALAALDALELEAQRAREELAAALLASQLAPPDGFSLASPGRLAQLGTLLGPTPLGPTLLGPASPPVESLRFADFASGELASLAKTRVWVSSPIWPDSASCENRVSQDNASGYELGLVRKCVGRITTNLYAYVGWGPLASVDPFGLCGWTELKCWLDGGLEFVGWNDAVEESRAAGDKWRDTSEAYQENVGKRRLDVSEDSEELPSTLAAEDWGRVLEVGRKADDAARQTGSALLSTANAVDNTIAVGSGTYMVFEAGKFIVKQRLQRAALGNVLDLAETGVQWGKGNNLQGMPWEDYLAAGLPPESRLPPNFKTFDFFDEATGLATSVKTLDTTTAAKVANPKQIYYEIKSQIDAAANFTSYELKQRALNSKMIASRQIQIAIPMQTTPAQWAQIQRAVAYGAGHETANVTVVVTRLR